MKPSVEKLTQAFWGSKVRRLTTVIGAALISPAWVLNFENWLTAHGMSNLLVDVPAPIANAIRIVTDPQVVFFGLGLVSFLFLDAVFGGSKVSPVSKRFRLTTVGREFQNAVQARQRIERQNINWADRERLDRNLDELDRSFRPMLVSCQERLGMTVPKLRGLNRDMRIAACEAYFERMYHMMQAGHLKQARVDSKVIASIINKEFHEE